MGPGGELRDAHWASLPHIRPTPHSSPQRSNSEQGSQRLEPGQSQPISAPHSAGRWERAWRGAFQQSQASFPPFSQLPSLPAACGSSLPTSHPLPGGGYPVYEQVLGLQVPVQHVAAVTEPQAFQQLEEERLGGQGGGHQTPGQDAAPSQGDAPPSSLSALSQSPIRLAAVSSV